MALSNEELLELTEEDNFVDEEEVVEETEEIVDETEETVEDDEETVDETEDDEETVEDSEEVEDDEEEAVEETDETSKLHKVKVNGEELEVSEDELIRGYSTNKAAQAKFRDADAALKQATEFIHLLKTDPISVLSQPELGIDLRALSEQYLGQQLRYENMTQEERELHDARTKLQQYEHEKRIAEEQQHNQKVQELETHYEAEYNNRITSALDKAGLPNTESTIRRMAYYMYEALNSDDPAIQNLRDEDIVELVHEDYINDFKTMFGSSDAETLTKILGDDVAKKIRTADIAKVKGNPKGSRTKKPVKGKSKVKENKLTSEEFNNYLDSF